MLTLPLAQAAAPTGGLFGNPLLLLGLLFLVMWFTMIRPQAKQAKAHRELVGGLTKGDRIVIVGGSHLAAGPDGAKEMTGGVHDIVIVHEVEGP